MSFIPSMSGDSLSDSPKIIVIADDLSGAAEIAGIAFTHGLSAEVQRQFDPSTAAQLIALDTNSRHLPPAAAANRVRQISEQVLACQPAWLYKKVDSVLRGNVRAEIDAVLQATQQPHATLIPANPSRGRTINAGRYRIDGVPLDQTAFAHDPDHPRRSSDVLTLLGPGNIESSSISIPDVENESQLDQLASQCDPTTLAAGAADFFETLLRIRGYPFHPSHPCSSAAPNPLRSPAMLVCGSPAAWPTRRDQCRAAGIPLATIDEPADRIPESGVLLLGIGDSPHESDSDAALTRLAKLAATILQASSATSLLAEGGATAAAITNQLGWTRFAVVATAPAGVGVLRPLAPAAPLFLIKPGSYPWPAEIWQAFLRCHHG